MDESRYLDKVINLFKTKGLSMSMEEIAQGICITKKTLYNRFNNKDELLKKCMIRVTQDLSSRISCINDTSKDVCECFSCGITAMRTFFREMSPVFFNDLMKFYPMMASDDHAFGSAYFTKLIESNIIRGQGDGTYKTNIDAAMLSNYISFSVFAFFRKYVMMGNDYSAEHYFSQIIEFNLNGLKNKI